MKTIYSEKQNKHSKMIKDLQNLPKVETPENFEFNLMTRINNKNFGNVENSKPVFNWIKFFAPSAVVVTAIILLFILLPTSEQINNPSLYQAQKLDSQTIVSNSIPAGKEFTKNQNTVKQNSNSTTQGKSVSPNRTVQNLSPLLPFGTSRSVSLDDYINGGRNSRNLQQGNVVHGGEESAPLDRFFVAEKPDQTTLKKYRAQADSLRKAQFKADSLKKVQKMP